MTDYMKEAERLTDDQIKTLLNEIEYGNMVTFDDYAYLIARQIEWHVRSALLAHIQRGGVAEGWQLAPKEPAREMWEAALAHITRTQSSCPVCSGDEGDYNSGAFAAIGQCCAIYADMLAAAPDHFRDSAADAPAPAEVLGETCIDGGKCHHACTDKCFRRECCAPLSGYAGPWAYAPAEVPMTQAATDVLAERQRQISVEGWTPEHDDDHLSGAIPMAAACYAAHAGTSLNTLEYSAAQNFIRQCWPWNKRWWKPTAPRRDLVKAAALLLAEIERLDRAALRGEVK